MTSAARWLERPLFSLILLSARATLRSRLVLALGLVLVVVIVALAGTVTGDGSPQGRMQAYLSWSLGFTGLVLCLSAVFLGTRLGAALRSGELTQVATSPVQRGWIPVAWWAGTLVVLVGLTALAHLATWAGAQAMLRKGSADDRFAMSEPLMARGVARSLRPDEDVLADRVEQRFQARRAKGHLPEGLTPDEARTQIERQLRLRLRTVPRGKSIQWTVDGVRPGSDAEFIVLRFRFSAHSDGPAAQESGLKVRGRFSFIVEGSDEPPAGRAGAWAPGETHQVRAPAWVTWGSPKVDVRFEHLDPRPHVVVFPERGVQILYHAGGFAGNLLRAALVLIARLSFLLAVGAALAALLDPKLAALAVLFVFAIGAAQGFLLGSLKPGLFGAIDGPLLALLRGVLWLTPDLGSPELPALLAGGEQISNAAVRDALLDDGFWRAGLIVITGGLLFGRRELGAIR